MPCIFSLAFVPHRSAVVGQHTLYNGCFFFFLPEMEILKAFGGEDLQGGSLEKVRLGAPPAVVRTTQEAGAGSLCCPPQGTRSC